MNLGNFTQKLLLFTAIEIVVENVVLKCAQNLNLWYIFGSHLMLGLCCGSSCYRGGGSMGSLIGCLVVKCQVLEAISLHLNSLGVLHAPRFYRHCGHQALARDETDTMLSSLQ